jgi:signal transduction histidine kinase/DNA-binding response OmpR family regulator
VYSFLEGGGEVGALMRSKDWASTPLGPPDGWPQSLRTVVRIVLTSRYAMWIGWGPDLAFLYNDAYARATLGAKHPWALGQPARLVWAEIWEQIQPRIDRVLRTGEATWDEGLMLFLERSGYREETYHTFSYSPLPADDGSIAGNFCVVTEETDRIIGERRLASLRTLAAGLATANSEQDVMAVVEHSVAADARDLPFAVMYVFDDEANARLVARAGIPSAHPAARPVEQVNGGDTIWPFAEVLSGAGVLTVEAPAGVTLPSGPWADPPRRAMVVPITPQGQPRPTAVFIAGLNPYRALDDTYRSFIGLFVGQIAAGLANARVYEEERQRSEALAAIDRAKTAFFSNVSHEFRTPLTLMLGPTEDALAGDGVMRRDELETVYRNELRLLKLVNSLLDFSRMEAGRARAHYVPIDLARFTADLASTFRSAIERGGLQFEVDTPPLPQPVYVDLQMWEKIVLNLLSNAFKFTLEGGIRVALRPGTDHVTLTVEDSGVGIPANELPRVFERFHRIEGTRARTHEGSGIGLALVQDLVGLHGGRISVQSREGDGAMFAVTLPLGSAHLPPDQIGTMTTTSAALAGAQAFVVEAERWLGTSPAVPDAAASSEPRIAAERARIVLADDNADMREYVQRLLGNRWEVEPVRDGLQALDAIQHRGADLVVTDVMMPALDGFGLLRALREDEATRHIPVLMLSARAGEEMRLEGLKAGADDYLVKPFSARELLARVEMLLLRASMRAVENLQRRQLADIFRQAPAAIAILRGPNHVYEHANPAYLELVAQRDVVGKPLRDALPELTDQGVADLLDRVYASGEPYVGKALRFNVVREQGRPAQECFFDFVYQPMRDATGEIDGIAVVAFDVTELAQARREAEAASRTKDEFLAMLGHELRNPLAPILTALQLMRVRAGSALEAERTVIERQTRHVVRLVDDLLDVSRIARGKIDLRRERLHLADAVSKGIEMASPLLEERNHALDVDVPRDLIVDADSARLAQVVANLLTNAAKYTEAGGRVAIHARRGDDEIVLSVRDSGIGIEPDMLPQIFDMFTQERQSLERTQGGLGLGLTIVRNMMALHGGRVEAFSAGRGQGSEFVLHLPAVDVAAVHPMTISSSPEEAMMVRDSGTAVLVVDDNADAAEMLAEYVGSLGYRVRSALDGPSALRVAEEMHPAIALLDIGLPVMDGFELARRLRDSDALADIKLVAITGYGQETDRERSREAGFDAHLVKPVDLDHLEQLLQELSAVGT